MAEIESRIDFYPTHEQAGFKLRAGKPFPFGATLVPRGVNFSVFSRHASACTLVLYKKHEPEPLAEIPFPDAFRIGNTWSMVVFDLDYEGIEYGYRVEGPWEPDTGHRFDAGKVLLDPYAKAIGGRDKWGETPDWEQPFAHRSRLAFEDFDWEDDRPLEIPIEDLVIYEMHVRSFTADDSSGVKFPGTFAGLMEKIPYLQSLGINCVELMPVFEFDEFENSRRVNGETLYNYWGYSTVGFFAPKAGYAATSAMGMQMDELKNLVKLLHRAGIEVMLDVVFNHTAEGNERGPTISYRGLDNQTYYMLTPEGYYYNFSGTGNTLNCNNPVVRNMVLDCLRYWASEYHIDGFRFDLASILGRDPWGTPLSNPPLLESLAFDPVLGKCKLIAEAWDAGGLYQVGSFPAYGRWAEWNGKYRDDLRRFLKGDEGMVGAMAQRLGGSPDLYGAGRGPTASINFITCHDGFTLYDLVAYNQKHNESNGEENRDGANDNNSWNCGAEGETDDAAVNDLRRRQIKNAITLLMVSRGVPMLLMGDEVGRSQSGNNNAYCHDNAISWFDWKLVERNADLLRYCRNIIAFRHAHKQLHPGHFSNIVWHGTRAYQADWTAGSRVLAYSIDCSESGRGTHIYVAANTYWDALPFALPALPAGLHWHLVANTSAPSEQEIFEPGDELRLSNQDAFLVGGRSVIVLLGR